MRDIAIGRRSVLLRLLSFAAAGTARSAAARPRGVHPLRRLPLVALDAGHGGIDPGTIAANGAFEKTITLATVAHLAALLLASRRFRVVMTRSSDEFVPLAERVARARAGRADLFLSLHADALPDPAMRGASVFTLSRQASDREAAALAVSENRDIVAGVNLSRQPRLIGDILYDLARRRTENLSIALARDLVVALGHRAALLERPQRAAGFVVLSAPDIPSVLVELGCLTNPVEGRLLQQPAYQRALAQALLRGIEAYFATHPPL